MMSSSMKQQERTGNDSLLTTTTETAAALRVVIKQQQSDDIRPANDYDKTMETKTGGLDTIVARPRGKRRTTLPKIAFCAVFRNMGNVEVRRSAYYKEFFRMAEAITSEFHIVIYENDSADATRTILKKMFGGANSTNVTMLFEDNVTDAPLLQGKMMTHNTAHKTARIARARNKVLSYVEDNFPHYDYMAMLDMDMLCTLDPQTSTYDDSIFQYVLMELHEEWDVLSFRQSPYFDWWALRYPPMLPGNLLHNERKKNKKGINRYRAEEMEPMIQNDFDSASFPHGLIEVESAFALFSFYRMSLLNGTARYRGVDEEGVVDCEHVAFHSDLIHYFGARIRISPLTYCIPGRKVDSNRNNTHRSLPQHILDELRANLK